MTLRWPSLLAAATSPAMPPKSGMLVAFCAWASVRVLTVPAAPEVPLPAVPAQAVSANAAAATTAVATRRRFFMECVPFPWTRPGRPRCGADSRIPGAILAQDERRGLRDGQSQVNDRGRSE